MVRRWALAIWHDWEVFVVRDMLRRVWDDLPGPWPVKVALIVATQLIPGQLDDLALLAAIRLFRVWRARQAVTA